MAQPLETWRSETATALPSSKDVFRLNPPEIFRYTDFVIRAPLPRVPRSMTEEAAKDKYPRTRLKRLIRIVEARLGKDRCFFSEFQSRDRKKDTQFNITKLYALYEVEHWPGALGQYEWTQFVIANMERDAAREQVGPDVKLALPMLPPSALPKYQEMMRQEGFELARQAQAAAQINGVALGGGHRVYASHDPRRHELHGRPQARHLSEQPQLMARLSNPPDIRQTLFEIPSGQLQAISRDDRMFRNACNEHKNWVDKESKSLTTYYIRCLGREPGSIRLTWAQLKAEARRLMGRSLNQQITQWARQEPNTDFELGNGTLLVERQLSFLTLRMKYHDPLPQKTSVQLQTEHHRKHYIVAMLQQRQSLREWTRAMAEQAKLCVGERYRKELEHVMDFWTGRIENLEAFDERNRKENTGLSSEMLSLGAQSTACTAQTQEQDRPPQVQNKIQAQEPQQATQSQVPAHQQKDPVEYAQPPTWAQENARTSTTVHAQGMVQAPTDEQAQPQSARFSQTQGHEQKQLDMEMTDSIQAQGHHQVQVDTQIIDSAQGPENHQRQVDAQIADSTQAQGHHQVQVDDQMTDSTHEQGHHQGQADTDMADSTQVQASDPMQPQACIAVEIPPAKSQTLGPEETQEDMRSQSQEPAQTQSLARFQAQLLMAAHSSEETMQIPPAISVESLNVVPLEEVVHERGQDEEQGQPLQQDLPSAKLPQPVPAPELVQNQAQLPAPDHVQEEVPPQAQDLSQVQPPLAQPKPPEALEASLFQQVIQAGLEHSMQADLRGPLEAQDVAPVTSLDQIREDMPAGVQEQGPMLLTTDAQPQEAPQAEEQPKIFGQDQDRMCVQKHVQEQGPAEEQAQTGAEQRDPQETQLHVDELGTLENSVVAKHEEAVDHEYRPPTQIPEAQHTGEAVDHESRPPIPFSEAQHTEEDHVDNTRPSDSVIQEEKTVAAFINKCHHCTRSKSRCNGERPCQSCLRYRKRCYDLDQPPARNMRGLNVQTGKRSKKKAEQPHSASPENVDDQRQQQYQGQVLPTQQVSVNESRGEATQQVLLVTAEPDSQLSDDESEHLDSLGASDTTGCEHSQAEDRTNYDKQQNQQTQSAQTKPARKPKQPTHKARNVTTRLAEQMEAEQGRRSLRAMAHRSHA